MLRRHIHRRFPGSRWAFTLSMIAVLSVADDGAAQAAPASPATPPAGTLDLDSMPDIGLDWPDLDQPVPTVDPEPEPERAESVSDLAPPPTTGSDTLIGSPGNEAPTVAESDAIAQLDPTALLRYHVSLSGLEEAGDPTLMSRFDMLSVLKQGEGSRANIAQVRRRGQSDIDLLDELLRARGYYDSRSRLRFSADSGGDPHVNVLLGANPGTRFLLAKVDVDGLDGASPLGSDLRSMFTVKQGDPVDTDSILAAVEKLREGLGEGGYPFANVREPVLTVDHQQRQAILALDVQTGGFKRFGQIRVNEGAPFDARHVGIISRFWPGEPYNLGDITDLNRAIVATGLVSQVTITPQESADPERVDLAITMTPAPARTISGEIGYGTGEGARIEGSWQHRNFFPPEGALTLRGVLGTQEQGLTATLRRNNLGKRDRVLNVEVSAANVDQPAYQALTAGIAANYERQTNLIFQKDWTWSFGAELRVSDERDFYGQSQTPRRRTYVIGALPTGITYDGSDDLLDPRKGFRLGARMSPEASLQNGVFGYLRAHLDGSAYVPMGERFTLAGRARLGTIVGASADRIAPTRRYYAGGGASVRGYSYQAIGPRDLNNDPVGGRSLGELSLEARFRFGSLDQFGIVPFIDAGTISADPWPSLKEMRIGAGLGFRYYSNFGPIRIDIGTPLNPQPGDSRIGVYVSLGQAF